LEAKLFVNFYEIFELEPSARPEDIERRFRALARQFHPDNRATGDRDRFDAIVEAHETLKDGDKRAQYHEHNRTHLPPLPEFAEEVRAEDDTRDGEDTRPASGVSDDIGIGRDVTIQNRILTLLYQKRRQHIRDPGIGNAELEHLSGCPPEHLEFHIWYMREKRWIATGENGTLAITIDGVDRAASIYQEHAKKLITDQT
jgi:curved DNA-binding protein CbpA